MSIDTADMVFGMPTNRTGECFICGGKEKDMWDKQRYYYYSRPRGYGVEINRYLVYS